MTTLNTGRSAPGSEPAGDQSNKSGSTEDGKNGSPSTRDFGKIKSVGANGNDYSEIASFFKTLAIFLVLAFFLRASVVEAFKIPSGSMRSTLIEGDHILVSKFSYGFRLPFMREVLFSYSQPKRGDVVVFTRPDDPASPEDDSEINIIKRVIGLPGEEVRVRGRKVYIDGAPLDEPYAQWVEGGPREGNFPREGDPDPGVVPDGKVLLLGDNRDRSKDPRFWTDHYLDMKLIKGRALVIYWSWESLSRIGTVIR